MIINIEFGVKKYIPQTYHTYVFFNNTSVYLHTFRKQTINDQGGNISIRDHRRFIQQPLTN